MNTSINSLFSLIDVFLILALIIAFLVLMLLVLLRRVNDNILPSSEVIRKYIKLSHYLGKEEFFYVKDKDKEAYNFEFFYDEEIFFKDKCFNHHHDNMESYEIPDDIGDDYIADDNIDNFNNLQKNKNKRK